MKKLIISINIIIATLLVSNGYGLWEKTLNISGEIIVEEVVPVELSITEIIAESKDINNVYSEEVSITEIDNNDNNSFVEEIANITSNTQPSEDEVNSIEVDNNNNTDLEINNDNNSFIEEINDISDNTQLSEEADINLVSIDKDTTPVENIESNVGENINDEQ